MATYINGSLIGVSGLITKIMTGTLDNDSSTSVAHGLVLANIREVHVLAYDTTNSRWSAAGTIGLGYTLDATNIVITNAANYNAQAYRIIIRYTG